MNVFKNTYLIMRHGQSEANVAGVIVSDPDIGCQHFGLTALGREQASDSVAAYVDFGITRIVCSDFLRTRETAAIAAALLDLPQPQIDTGLRERFFGVLEGQTHEHYQQVWFEDAQGGSPSEHKIESTHQVRQRALEVLRHLDSRFSDECILLVSHGDILQILRTAFVGAAAAQHRSLEHHETGEIRLLVERGTHWPE